MLQTRPWGLSVALTSHFVERHASNRQRHFRVCGLGGSAVAVGDAVVHIAAGGRVAVAREAARQIPGTENPETVVAELLDALGWMRGDGSPITAQSAAAAAYDVKDTLRRLGLLRRTGSGPDRWEQPTRNAVDFARAALTAWPP